ncbi:class I SAM-dependent methyltransferase [Brevifollis gellanilyticus]|uniref:Methyltransferase type 11 n=1 Tax=Brevifollis gellanilyticus TaxID=748831 RepID=A0A512M7A5_9BACT|nr:class I SAM-dependent methyltransferase [Brevifollis gellanilyticus]GEP42620.1 methyltransferase type 11 [Brevifollis gellanilyticus]
MRHQVLLTLLLPLLAVAQQPATPPTPPALKEYEGRVIAQTMHWQGANWLIRNKREREEGVAKMREELHLKPGMAVCDMGAGNGYHTIPMAEAVGATGKVYAVDVQPEMIVMLNERAIEKGITSIQTIVGEYHDPKLPANSCDLVLLVDVYHEFSHPVQMLEGMKKALKPGGQICLVEFRAEDDEVPIKPEHKMSKVQILKEMKANGLKLEREFDGLPWQHMMFFGLADAK